MRVERGGRLVEDDEAERLLGDGEGTGHLDHLALADRQVADDVAGADAVAGKDLVELGANELAGAPPPADAGERRMEDAGILGDGQVRAEREFLEDAADAELLRESHAGSSLLAAVDGDPAAVGAKRAGEDVHQRRLAGAVVADEPDAFAGVDREIDAVERADGAEMLFDAVQPDDVRACLGHQRKRPNRLR